MMDRRMFLQAGLMAGAGLALPRLVHGREQGRRAPLLPPALRPGDTVAIVSPSGATTDPLSLQLAEEAMQALSLKTRPGQHALARYGHLAGTDAQRAADLNAAFADPAIKAVICLRGGSGAARLLPLLDYAIIRRHPKILLGYSDITALHCALQAQVGLVTFHGPIGGGSWNSFNADQFRRLLFAGELLEYRNPQARDDELVVRQNRTVTLTGGRARGALIGGNLAVLTALAGSSYLPDFRGRILFLEDVSEQPYRIDRMFSTLQLMGALGQIAGFVFGQCSECEPGEGSYGSLSLPQILDDFIKPLGIPAYRGALIGHIREQFILPVGGQVELDADAGTLRLLAPVLAPDGRP